MLPPRFIRPVSVDLVLISDQVWPVPRHFADKIAQKFIQIIKSSNLIDHCRSETLSCQVLMQWQDIFIPEDNQALLGYQNTKTHLNICTLLQNVKKIRAEKIPFVLIC